MHTFYSLYSGSQYELTHKLEYLPYFSRLLVTADQLQKTTKWLIQRGILGQFRGASDSLYYLCMPTFPACNLFWLCYDVREVTRNILDNTLKGRSVYSSEGVPFSEV
jgi:hypothetical protein